MQNNYPDVLTTTMKKLHKDIGNVCDEAEKYIAEDTPKYYQQFKYVS